ncbi:hypothetical protein RvY_00848-2 [Ramazzottius varieornatus]|uniref:C2 domain-containing protein n=1 Tax=Ramazzottius varieornatus TaxID=947166 RepID=A0A1D1UPK2_RAMVA|nr:hypothetical protein RvY_00848-2 [Ramazzottius varieornatus]
MAAGQYERLFPFDYERKLSSYSSCTGYSAYSSDTCKTNDSSASSPQIRISLQYRLYYDLDNGDLILHVLQAHFTPVWQAGIDGLTQSSPERQKPLPYRDTYVTFTLRAPGRERRCGQTKISHTDNSQTVNYDEVFALPVNHEALLEQRLHFDIFCYNSYSRPQILGSADTLVDTDVLDGTERWIDLATKSASPTSENLREINDGSARSEILIFLSFHIAREELTVDILKAKNVTGLFPVRSQSETSTEVYVKTCLIINEQKIKRRTNAQYLHRATNATAVWNESLSYPVKYAQLEQCVLLLYVVEHRKDTQREKTVGKCVIGPFGGASTDGYLQWQQQGSASVIRSNAMWHTVVRYSTDKKAQKEKLDSE